MSRGGRRSSLSDPARHVSFTVPGGWRPIGAAALTAELSTTASGEMSDDGLRDILLPVTAAARQKGR